MTHFSGWSLLKQGWNKQQGWTRQWRAATPRRHYDVIIIGGGGHGLATAHYLARNHGIKNVAVIEKGWIGGGNSGRNTAIIRSNYYYRPSIDFYARSHQLYETLSRDLNYNIMFSPRGLVQIVHSRHELETMRRWVNAMALGGVATEWLSVDDIQRLVPLIDCDPGARFPIHGGYFHRTGGIARHDAVVWAYARSASAAGVDIIENCEVTGIAVEGGRATGIATTRGPISCDRISIAVAGRTSELVRMAGLELPIESFALQAFVSEPIKPVLDVVAVSGALQAYVSQSDKGELVIGSRMDGYPSYAQRGSPAVIEDSVAALLALFPSFSRLKMLRQWAGIVDVTPDRSPIVGTTPIDGITVSAGWGTGGFKAIPAGGECMASTIATGRAHPLIESFAAERFRTGALVDESAASGVAH